MKVMVLKAIFMKITIAFCQVSCGFYTLELMLSMDTSENPANFLELWSHLLTSIILVIKIFCNLSNINKTNPIAFHQDVVFVSAVLCHT